MSTDKHRQRRREYFSSLKKGDILTGTVMEYIGENTALVDMNGFLVRCVMKKRVAAGTSVRLTISEFNTEKNLVVMKVV